MSVFDWSMNTWIIIIVLVLLGFFLLKYLAYPAFLEKIKSKWRR